MKTIDNYIHEFSIQYPLQKNAAWEILVHLKDILQLRITALAADDNYDIQHGIAIHKTAVIENNVTMKAPVIISADCFVAANVYLREGVHLMSSVKIGAGCEIKSSIVFPGSSIAHFNYIGDSIIGHNVNFEAGSVTANHYNERANKKISVLLDGEIKQTNVEKFGALVGDNSRVGANAVLSPGTVLLPGTIVKRLELIEQIKQE